MFCIRYALRCGSRPALKQPAGLCLHKKDGEQEKSVHELGGLLLFAQNKVYRRVVWEDLGTAELWRCKHEM